MQLMSYNILNGGLERLPLILEVIKSIGPDFLAIQEANTFTKDNYKILKQFSKELLLPYFDISLSGEGNWHVSSFSKYPFKKVSKIKKFRNAALQTVVDTDFASDHYPIVIDI